MTGSIGRERTLVESARFYGRPRSIADSPATRKRSVAASAAGLLCVDLDLADAAFDVDGDLDRVAFVARVDPPLAAFLQTIDRDAANAASGSGRYADGARQVNDGFADATLNTNVVTALRCPAQIHPDLSRADAHFDIAQVEVAEIQLGFAGAEFGDDVQSHPLFNRRSQRDTVLPSAKPRVPVL